MQIDQPSPLLDGEADRTGCRLLRVVALAIDIQIRRDVPRSRASLPSTRMVMKIDASDFCTLPKAEDRDSPPSWISPAQAAGEIRMKEYHGGLRIVLSRERGQAFGPARDVPVVDHVIEAVPEPRARSAFLPAAARICSSFRYPHQAEADGS